MFKRGTSQTTGETTHHLFQCSDEKLGNDILKSYPNAVSGTETALLTAIKQLAVTLVAVGRSDRLSMKQDHGENVRFFFARISGKAATCAYNIECPSTTCTQHVYFYNVIAKDVLITGLVNDDIRRC
jgi:hypothetical protein